MDESGTYGTTAAGMTPPVESVETDLGAPDTKWPQVIGIISIIYATLGLFGQLCSVGYVVFLMPMFAEMAGAKDLPAQGVLQWQMLVQGVVLFALGILLLVGGIGLLRRRRAAVSRLKTWAILRMIFLVLGIIAGILLLPASLEYQQQMNEAMLAQAEADGRPAPPMLDEDQQWFMTVIMMIVMSVVIAIYPIFLGFFLSRETIKDEVAHWE